MKIKALILSLIAIISLTNYVHAQDYSGLGKIEMNDKSDFQKQENQVLECSNYLLNSPIDALDNDQNHMSALQFIMRWMEGTPDYNFNIDETIGNVMNTNASLLGIYMAAMSKYVLEHKDKASDFDDVKYNSFLIFIKYCEDGSKKVEQTDEIKELIKARDEDHLKDFLKIQNSDQKA